MCIKHSTLVISSRVGRFHWLPWAENVMMLKSSGRIYAVALPMVPH